MGLLRDHLFAPLRSPRRAHQFRSLIGQRFLRDCFALPAARAYVLTQAAVAEGSDEGEIFERLLPHVNDPTLQKAIRTHQADEKRHAEMFWAVALRQGTALAEIPESEQLLPILRAELGGFDFPVVSERDVAIAYLVLQVIEERALDQFALLRTALAPFDPEAAAVIVEVMADEERHLKYCHAITRRYLPDTAARTAELARLRQAEARAFAIQQQRSSARLLALPGVAPARRIVWQTALRGMRAAPGSALPYTKHFASA